MNPLIAPLVAAQAVVVKRRTVRLPPAGGPTSGATCPSRARSLRLAVVGESTAAGCGATTHDEAFAGHLAHHLADVLDVGVHWEAHGTNGATLARIVRDLVPSVSRGADVVVLLAGVNDVLHGTSPGDWERDLGVALTSLRRRGRLLVVSGVPPFDCFPALPRPLGAHLRERGEALDEVTRGVCARTRGVLWLSTRVPAGAEAGFFAADGFHPSPQGYRTWADQVGQAIRVQGPVVLDPRAGRPT